MTVVGIRRFPPCFSVKSPFKLLVYYSELRIKLFQGIFKKGVKRFPALEFSPCTAAAFAVIEQHAA